MSLIGGANAIGWAQFQLRGGWKNVLATTAAYMVLVGGGILLLDRLNASAPAIALAACTRGLLGLQLLILVLFAVTRVSTAIRADLNSKIIESHRLMPVSAGEAILGYLFGSTSQATALAIANVLLGLATTASAGVPVDGWIAANAILFLFAIFLWALSALGGFLFKATWLLMMLFGMAFWISQGQIAVLIPAVTLLTSPLIGKTVFSARPMSSYASPAYATSILSQLAIGGICLVAAGRKYRRPESPAFGAVPGLMLLGAWVGASAFGIAYWDQLRPEGFGDWDIDRPAQLLGSMFSAMVIALAAFAAGAKRDFENRRRRAAGLDSEPSLWPRLPLTALVATAIIILVLPSTLPEPSTKFHQQCAQSAAVLFLFFIAAEYAMRICFRIRLRADFVVGAWLLLISLGPLLGDAVRYTLNNDTGNPLSTISACSPIGALVCIWINPEGQHLAIEIWTGIGAQAALVCLLALIYYRIAPRPRHTTPGHSASAAPALPLSPTDVQDFPS